MYAFLSYIWILYVNVITQRSRFTNCDKFLFWEIFWVCSFLMLNCNTNENSWRFSMKMTLNYNSNPTHTHQTTKMLQLIYAIKNQKTIIDWWTLSAAGTTKIGTELWHTLQFMYVTHSHFIQSIKYISFALYDLNLMNTLNTQLNWQIIPYI